MWVVVNVAERGNTPCGLRVIQEEKERLHAGECWRIYTGIWEKQERL